MNTAVAENGAESAAKVEVTIYDESGNPKQRKECCHKEKMETAGYWKLWTVQGTFIAGKETQFDTETPGWRDLPDRPKPDAGQTDDMETEAQAYNEQAAIAAKAFPNEKPLQQPKPRNWTTDAGPIQSKKVNQALQNVRVEGQSYTEKYGVIGVDESSHSFYSPFGGMREDAREALNQIGDRFNWHVTRENYQQIIAAAAKAVEELMANRPVQDKRRTPDQEAELTAKRQTAEAERHKQETEKAAQVHARAMELRNKYPWAEIEGHSKLSSSARAARNMKEELSRRFPGQPFSVRSDYNSIGVKWLMGPTTDQVKEVTDKYQHSTFDGQTDSTDKDNSVEGKALEQILGRVRFVSETRDREDGVINRLCLMLCAMQNLEYTGEYQTGLQGKEDCSRTVSDHAWQLFNRTPFGPGERIVGVEPCEWEEGVSDNDTFHWCRIVTEKTEVAPPEQTTDAASGVIVRRNIGKNGVEVVFPSKPAGDVIDRLKAAGFRWSKFSKCWYKKFGSYAWAQAHTIAGLPMAPSGATAAEAESEVDQFDKQVEDRMAEACGLTNEHE